MLNKEIKLHSLSVIILLIFITAPISGAMRNLCLYGGAVHFSDLMQDAMQYGVGLKYSATEELGFQVSASHMRTKPLKGQEVAVDIIPLEAGLTYGFFSNQSISPYVTGLAVLAFASHYLSSPMLGCGVKTGFSWRLFEAGELYLEASKYLLYDTANNCNLSPMSFNLGLNLELWRTASIPALLEEND